MKIAFYSTNSTHFDSSSFHYLSTPTFSSQLSAFLKNYAEIEVVIVSNLPGMFLFDYDNKNFLEKTYGVKYIVLETSDYEKVASIIEQEKVDLAVAFTFWVKPFDWLGINDALVKNELEKNGIKTICNSLDFQKMCFNKWETHKILSENGFSVPKAIYVQHELFFSEKMHVELEIENNVYKEAIFYQLRNFSFPVVIKDAFGLSSYSIEVAKTFNEAKAFLLSKKNNSDKIIEEYIEGEHFGCEIYSDNCLHGLRCKKYVSSIFMFSKNQYGVTSPKQNIKIGPIDEKIGKKFEIAKLNKEISRFSKTFSISGSCQIDLVFSQKLKKWFFIEINSRLSGMSEAVAFSNKTNIFEMMIFPKKRKTQFVIDIKLPILSAGEAEKLKQNKNVLYLLQIKNDVAKQKREKGFTQLIFGECDTIEELKKAFDEFYGEVSNLAEETNFEKDHFFSKFFAPFYSSPLTI